MPYLLFLYSVSIISFVAMTGAQCVDPGFIPCLPAGSQLGGVPSSNFDNSGFWDSLGSGASNSSYRRALVNRLVKRQDALCCSPDPNVQCDVITDGSIPFCYDTQTTRYDFSDTSFGYISNGTYYGADGTFVDFDTGYYSSIDGSTGTFAPATPAPTTATQQDSGSAPTTTHATPMKQSATNTASTSQPAAPAVTQPKTTQAPVSKSATNQGATAAQKDYVASVAVGLLLTAVGSFIFM